VCHTQVTRTLPASGSVARERSAMALAPANIKYGFQEAIEMFAASKHFYSFLESVFYISLARSRVSAPQRHSRRQRASHLRVTHEARGGCEHTPVPRICEHTPGVCVGIHPCRASACTLTTRGHQHQHLEFWG
jgi:hypothetical protein